MGILSRLELLFNPGRKPKEVRIDLKEIVCKPKGKPCLKQIKTAVVGADFSNIDGSNRQEALSKLKVGEKVRLIWNRTESKDIVYLVRGGRTQEFSMSDCFGRLDDKVATEVVRWLTQDNIVTSAKVARIVGGTRKRPKLSCVVELSTYQGPEAKS